MGPKEEKVVEKKEFRLNTDFVTGIVLFIVSVFFLFQTNAFPVNSRLFPQFALVLFGFLSVLLAISGFLRGMKGDEGIRIRLTEIQAPMTVALLLMVFIGIMSYANYFVATVFFVPALMLYFKVKNVKLIAGVTFVLTAGMYVLFVLILGVRL